MFVETIAFVPCYNTRFIAPKFWQTEQVERSGSFKTQQTTSRVFDYFEIRVAISTTIIDLANKLT
jgi:hypothetical protein